MVISLHLTNDLNHPIEVKTSVSSPQPLQPHQALELVVEYHEDMGPLQVTVAPSQG